MRFSEVGSCVIAGRSDATLNRGGVRLGTAEFYRVVEELPEVADSLVVHLEDPAGGNGRAAALRAAPPPASSSTTTLRRTDRDRAAHRRCRRGTSPTRIAAVPAVPRNRTGKKLELPVKRILLGAAAGRRRQPRRARRPDLAGPVRRARQRPGRATHDRR